ncbi:uncharacterized protein LOC120176861 [Hibiscus syriacus]|uniref:uncharacterized protein LOC120176861 n=1 Tax=Hibiscus syriacus TaxID=106335 RepID=UPI001920FC6D|nr:uncharacterized protein LOC120176861 [Hibiscus syriacus]
MIIQASRARGSFGKECVTIIIFNIPEFLHHKGLWRFFVKYGEVIDSFIPIKRSKGGSRFGFVRFTSLADARKAISCADRSWIQGNKVRVFMARFQPREAFWRKKCSVPKLAVNKSRVEDANLLKTPIIGVIDEDKLFTLKDSLVSWCRKFFKLKELATIMQKEGILRPRLMRLSGLAILIIFEDEESMNFTLNNQSEALQTCFGKVEVWSENVRCNSRRAWLSCKGIPPFVWSPSTFRNLVGKWGELISIEDETLNPGSFDRALFQVITNQQARVEEIVELRVGDRTFSVFVSEFEPCFNPESVWEDSLLLDEAVAYPVSPVGERDMVSPVMASERETCAGLSFHANLDHSANREFIHGLSEGDVSWRFEEDRLLDSDSQAARCSSLWGSCVCCVVPEELSFLCGGGRLLCACGPKNGSKCWCRRC